MKHNNKLLQKLFLSGILLLFIPLLVFVTIIILAFWQLKSIHNEYGTLVSDLKTDIENIDKEILGYKTSLNKNQNQTQKVNHKLSLRIMNKEMLYSAVKLSMQLQNNNKTVSNNNIMDAYFYNPSLFKTTSSKSVLPKQPLSSNTPKSNAKVLQTKQNQAKTKFISSKLKKLSDLKQFKIKFQHWCNEHKIVLTNSLATKLENFTETVKLGVGNKKVFIVEHTKLNKMKILWSNTPEWQFKDLNSISDELFDALISARYVKHFWKFQNNKAKATVVYKLVYPQSISYTNAKYQIAKQSYWGLIPIYGTNLSLGIFTPLNNDVLQSLDSVVLNLGTISSYLGKTSSNLRTSETQVYKLESQFKYEINKFNRVLLFVIVIMILFLVTIGYIILKNLKNKVVTPILHITDVTNRIANGEYGVRTKVDTNDELEELAHSVNAMLDKIIKYIRTEEVQQAIQKDIITMLEVVSYASKGDLTIRGEVVTDDLQAVMDAFNHMIISIGTMVVSVKKSGENVDSLAQQLLDTLQEIKEKSSVQATTLDLTSRKIKALGDRSQEISRMLDQIDAIITDTNNLAFNVSLEAAKLDEKHLGISHLVDNVNRLVEALRTTKKDIASLIGTIQMSGSFAEQSMHDIIELTSETLQKMENAHNIALNTVTEADELKNTISIFKIKTEEDLEYEKKLLDNLNNLTVFINEMSKIIRKMNTSEYTDLLKILDRFSTNIKGYDVSTNIMELKQQERAIIADIDVPAILEEETDDINNENDE